MSLTRVFTHTATPLLGLATLAALGLAASPASAQTTINFDNFTTQANIVGFQVGPSYSTQGFTLSSVGTTVLTLGSNLIALGSNSLGGDGETSLYSDSGATKLSQDNGKTFSLNAIDLGPFAGNSLGTFYDGPILFTGTHADGSTVTATETTTGKGFQKFNGFTGFTDLTSVTFQGTYNILSKPNGSLAEFDNIVLNSPVVASAAPEPSQMVGLGFAVLGLGGLFLRAYKRKLV